MMDIAWLCQYGTCKAYSKGQIIQFSGEDEDSAEKSMYILLEGRVDVADIAEDASPTISLFPGDVFGGEEYFTDKIDKTYTVAVDSVVYPINESSFAELSWSQPDIVFEVLKASYLPQGRPYEQSKDIDENTATDDVKEDEKKQNTQETKKSDPAIMSDMQYAISSISGLFPEGHKHYPNVIRPEYSKLVYEKDYTCPYCKKKFMDYRVFSSKLFEAAPMRYDLRRHYTDFQTEWYDIITCRHCYFSTISTYYTESRPLMKQRIDSVISEVRASIFLDFDAERDIDFVFTTHYLALACAEGYMSQAAPLRAKIWGNLSWLYEDVEDKEMEQYATEKAAEAYENVYITTNLTPVQEQMTCLSIAGMQLRAGIDRDLRKYLFHARTVKMGDKAYSIMAETMMEDLRMNAEPKNES